MEKIWMKHWPPDMAKEVVLTEGKIPIFEYLRINARRTPAKPAIINYGREISYQELDETSDQFANYLLDLGLVKGDRLDCSWATAHNTSLPISVFRKWVYCLSLFPAFQRMETLLRSQRRWNEMFSNG